MDETSIAFKIKEILNTYMTDPRVTAGGSARTNFCNLDVPRTDATYPRIQIDKQDSTNDIIGIGTDYAERTFCYYRIWFYSKKDFKVTVSINSVDSSIQDESLVAYYLKQIKNTLKLYQSTTQALDIDGFKMLGIGPIDYDPDTNLYKGYLTIRYWFFTMPT